jgi:hypothetical protein
LLESRKTPRALRRGSVGGIRIGITRREFFRHLRVWQRLAEIEEGALHLLGIGQDAEIDLEMGQAAAANAAGEAFPRGSSFHCLGSIRRGNPPVAVAEQDDQEWPAALDLAETDLEHLNFARAFVSFGFGGDADPQVDPYGKMAPLA